MLTHYTVLRRSFSSVPGQILLLPTKLSLIQLEKSLEWGSCPPSFWKNFPSNEKMAHENEFSVTRHFVFASSKRFLFVFFCLFAQFSSARRPVVTMLLCVSVRILAQVSVGQVRNCSWSFSTVPNFGIVPSSTPRKIWGSSQIVPDHVRHVLSQRFGRGKTRHCSCHASVTGCAAKHAPDSEFIDFPFVWIGNPVHRRWFDREQFDVSLLVVLGETAAHPLYPRPFASR